MGQLLSVVWSRIEEGVIALLLAFITILTFLQVVLRYGFNTGLLWAQEATLYAFAWLVIFGLSYGFKTRAHLGIDAVVKLMPVPMRRRVGLLAIAACLLFAGMMIFGSLVYLRTLYDVGLEAEDLPIERWVLGSILPIGFGLVAVRLIAEAVRVLRGEASGFEIADEAGDVLREHGAPETAATKLP